MPLNFGNVLRVVPYVQGQAVGWTNQINGEPVGRVWGAAGARAEIMAWKRLPERRERAVQRPRPEPQDQLRRPTSATPTRTCTLEPDRRPGRPRRQHVRVRPSLLRADQLRGRPPAAAVRPPLPDPPPRDLADHRHDRHPGDRSRPSSSASTSGSRPSAGPRAGGGSSTA